MAHGKVKLSVMVDVKTADEIDKMFKAWNMSLSGTLRFMIKHYLRFGIKNLKGSTMFSTKDELIKILKEANAEKDQVINSLTSDLVFSAHQIIERDKTVQALKDMI